MKNVLNSWQRQSGRMVSHAGSAEIQTIVEVRHHIQGDVLNAKQKNRLLQVQYFIIASFPYTRLFILLTTFAREKKIFLHMNLHEGYHFAR
jgi:hypothetical protein